jgi:NAD(P)-dependent dehydrogenase (short-subunit alcohol dehydrogenase family)
VTGGSQGLGLATALILAKRGAHVSIVARDQAKLDAALEELEVRPTQSLTLLPSQAPPITSLGCTTEPRADIQSLLFLSEHSYWIGSSSESCL